MAFMAGKETFARQAAFSHAETVLTAYLAGREKLYAVTFALDELRALFGPGAASAVDLVHQAIALDPDDDRRHGLVMRALDLIGRQVRADGLGL